MLHPFKLRCNVHTIIYLLNICSNVRVCKICIIFIVLGIRCDLLRGLTSWVGAAEVARRGMLAFWSVVIPGAWQLLWVLYLGCSAFQHLHVYIFLPAFGLNATVYDKFRNVTTIHPGMVMLYLKAPFENTSVRYFYFVDTNSRTFFLFFFFFFIDLFSYLHSC